MPVRHRGGGIHRRGFRARLSDQRLHARSFRCRTCWWAPARSASWASFSTACCGGWSCACCAGARMPGGPDEPGQDTHRGRIQGPTAPATRCRSCRHRHCGRQPDLPARPVRLRQVHAAQHGRRVRPTESRRVVVEAPRSPARPPIAALCSRTMPFFPGAPRCRT